MGVPSVGAFGLLTRDGAIYLVANWRSMESGRELCWDVPGGGVEEGESLVDACRREMLEETGFSVAVTDLAFVIERFGFRGRASDAVCRYYFFHVRAEGDPSRPRDEKIVDGGFKSPQQIATLCRQPYHAELHTWLSGGRRQRYFLDRP